MIADIALDPDAPSAVRLSAAARLLDAASASTTARAADDLSGLSDEELARRLAEILEQ